jgi:hypothetical protein
MIFIAKEIPEEIHYKYDSYPDHFYFLPVSNAYTLENFFEDRLTNKEEDFSIENLSNQVKDEKMRSLLRISHFSYEDSFYSISFIDSNPESSSSYILYKQESPFIQINNEANRNNPQSYVLALDNQEFDDKKETERENSNTIYSEIEIKTGFFDANIEINTSLLIYRYDADGKIDKKSELVYRINAISDIIIDGDFSDWKEIPIMLSAEQEKQVFEGPDWKYIKAAKDMNYLYIFIESYNEFTYTPSGEYSRVNIFFDMDCSEKTGYEVYLPNNTIHEQIVGIGSEILLNGSTLFQQKRKEYIHSFLSEVIVAPNPTSASDKFEIKIPLTVLMENAVSLSNIRVAFQSIGNIDSVSHTSKSIIISL